MAKMDFTYQDYTSFPWQNLSTVDPAAWHNEIYGRENSSMLVVIRLKDSSWFPNQKQHQERGM